MDCQRCRRLEDELDHVIMVCEGVVAGVAFRRTDLCELLKVLRRNKNARSLPQYKTPTDADVDA